MNNLQNSSLFINGLYKKFFTSTVISIFVRSSVQFISSIIAGNQLGPLALGTIGLLTPFSFIYMSALSGLYEIGCTVICSRYLSSNDYEGAKKMVSAAYISNLIFCVLIAIVGFIFMDNILNAINIPQETYGEARRYAAVYLVFGFFISSVAAGNSLLKFDGYLKRLIAINSIAPLISLSISLVLIRYAGFGLSAVAIGTCGGYFLTGIFMLYLTAVKTKVLGFAKIRPGQIFAIFKGIARNGLPNTVGDFGMIFAIMVINAFLLNTYGQLELAAYSAYNTLGILSAISYGGPLALVQIAGLMNAERDSTSVKQVIRISLLYGMICITVFAVLVMFFSGQIASLFGMGHVLELMRMMILSLVLSHFFDTLFFTLYFVFVASGRNVEMTALLFFKRIGFLLPPVFIFSGLFGIAGVWHALWICPALCILGSVIYSFIRSNISKNLTKVFLIDTEAEKNGTYISFSSTNDFQNITNCAHSVSGFCEKNALDKTRAHLIALAIEEMLILISEYSLKKSDLTMNVRILLYKDDVIMRIRYSGDLFNPLKFYEEYNLSGNMTLKEALGRMEFLGLKMVVGAVKKTDYCETFGINNLTITI